ncbi:MAG TPA: hypothetical protein VGC84_10955 [Ilumatobacteraceae bacterium]|jgi:hypothetical protein
MATDCGDNHWLRKGYYEDSDADYRCMLCGAEFSEEDSLRYRSFLPMSTDPSTPRLTPNRTPPNPVTEDDAGAV